MHTCWTLGPAITLAEILDAREHRAWIQQELLLQKPASLLSFTLNIAGPVKVTPFTKWLYHLGCRLIQRGIQKLDGTILEMREEKKDTGWEGFFSLSLSPEIIKSYLVEQELQHPLGRLFDFDLLRPDGSKVSRQELGFSARTCLICGNPAFSCGRSRTHSAQELQAKTTEMIQDFYTERMSVHIGMLMQKALLYEVNTSLKPGLVDRLHNGSHKDMCIDTFVQSAYALTPYFIECAKTGLAFEGSDTELPDLFLKLRTLGIQAESTMLQATKGINTHKGIIFSGGIFCGAAGYAASAHMADFKDSKFPELMASICENMLSGLLDDYQNITLSTARTHGEKLYAHYGITGIRGEAAKGFPHVFKYGFPAFQKALETLSSLNKAGLIALLYYVGNTEDTNLIIRSDYETSSRIQHALSAFSKTADYEEQLEILPALDTFFVSRNISPGGSADMLALTYFLYFLSEKDCWFES
nr:citrate lyase holo-[acyl-carrier protein] synthase [uncultured Blautia sp.]